MFAKRFTLAALASLGAFIACTDRPAVTASPAAASPPSGASQPPEALARAVALALRDAAFRGYMKEQLDGSPYREHKLQFQHFLAADGGRAAQLVARHSGVAPAEVARAAEQAIPLELYFPVPAHRAAWRGDGNVLVATALKDHDPPVAFDPAGRREMLRPDAPPETPVLALVPVETDFSAPPARAQCYEGCDGGGGGYPPPPSAPPPSGLYMTQSHFTQTFEGWLKGDPEFEVHILGQKDQTDSLKDYQCAGEKQLQPYYFDQNDLDWSGSVLLFSKTQLDDYHAAHPGQEARVFVVEDDDTACQIKTDNNLFQQLEEAVDAANQALTAGKDTTASTAGRIWKFAKALQKLLTAVGSLINSNDELVGNAVEDSIAAEYHDGFNWIVKGDNNVTNGWMKLEMR